MAAQLRGDMHMTGQEAMGTEKPGLLFFYINLASELARESYANASERARQNPALPHQAPPLEGPMPFPVPFPKHQCTGHTAPSPTIAACPLHVQFPPRKS